MVRYALVLFDEDGCTDVVETKKLRCEGKLQPSKQATFGVDVGPQYKVEVLDLSDSKVELNVFEKSWAKTQRSFALDQAKKRRGAVIGGYLSVWPQESNIIVTDDSEDMVRPCEVAGEVVRRLKKTVASSSTASTSSTPATRDTPQNPTAEVELPVPVAQNPTIMGTNGRKVTVLYEGGGDYTKQGSSPQRCPFHTDHLKSDQTDILTLQVKEFGEGKRTFSTQTSKVVVMESETDVTSLLEKKGEQKEVQCGAVSVCACNENVFKCVKENSEKLDKLTELVLGLKERLDDKFDNSLISVSLLESLNTVQDLSTQHIIVNHSNADEEKAENERTDEVQVNVDLELPFTSVDNDYISTESIEVEIPSVIDENFTATPLSAPLVTNILSPVQQDKKSFSRMCSAGAIIEIKSVMDVPSGECELRIHPDMQRKCKNVACSLGNFGWLLARQVFTSAELCGKNYHGKRGKDVLSPRRVHAIEHACLDSYITGDHIRHVANAINSGIRNTFRQPLKKITEN